MIIVYIAKWWMMKYRFIIILVIIFKNLSEATTYIGPDFKYMHKSISR